MLCNINPIKLLLFKRWLSFVLRNMRALPVFFNRTYLKMLFIKGNKFWDFLLKKMESSVQFLISACGYHRFFFQWSPIGLSRLISLALQQHEKFSTPSVSSDRLFVCFSYHTLAVTVFWLFSFWQLEFQWTAEFIVDSK